MIKRLLLSSAAIAVLLSVALPAGAQGERSPLPLGKPAPDITVKGLDGKAVKLSSLRGKPVFIDFWATWCPPCRASLPHTQKISKLNGKKITVLAISNEDAKTIGSFMKENKYSFPAFRDTDNSAGTKYKVQGIPTFVVIDAKGNLVDYIVGYAGDGPIDSALAKVGIK